jgi:hypothetical protein
MSFARTTDVSPQKGQASVRSVTIRDYRTVEGATNRDKVEII